MRLSIFLLLLITITTLENYSQNYYNGTYDFGYFDNPTAIKADYLDNVFVCGWSEDINNENQLAFAIKVDNYGEEIWRITEDTISKYYDLCLMENGNIAIVGSKNNSCFLKVVDSSNGNEVWSYHEPDSLDFWFGTVNEQGWGDSVQLRPIKTINDIHYPTIYAFESNTGQLIDQFQRWDIAHAVEFSFKQSSQYLWFGEKDRVIWSKFDGSFPVYWTYGALHTLGMDRFSDDRGIIVTYKFWAETGYYMELMTTELPYGGLEVKYLDFYYTDVEVTGSGMLGYEKVLITGTYYGQLILWIYDNNLELQEERLYPSPSPMTGIDVIGLESNNIVIMGYETIYNGNSTNVFLLKRDSNGTVSYPELMDQEEIEIYPNPISEKMYIKNTGNLNIEVELVNCFGHIVMKTNQTNEFISLGSVPSGYYIAIIKHNGICIDRQKLIIQ